MSGSVLVVGTAGSGKTVFCAVLRRYLQSQSPDKTIINVNLDPAVQTLPYTAEIDVREYLDMQEIVDTYELGPNGAMVHATDLVASHMETIMEEIEDHEADAVIVDTPGQLEIFVYRAAGPIIASRFDPDSTACLFLFDSNIVRRASSWISVGLLAASTQFRLQLPMVYALSKVDLLGEEDLARMQRWAEDVDFVVGDMDGGQESPYLRDLAISLSTALQEVQSHAPVVPFSSLEEEGIEDLAAFLSRVWEKGDDWTI